MDDITRPEMLRPTARNLISIEAKSWQRRRSLQ
jgi:hypothetical protein